jgi:cell division protein ZapA
MSKTRTTVYLAGQEFRLSSERSEEHLQKLAVFINKRINDVQAANSTLSTFECALLAMYKLADEYHESKEAYDKLESRIDNLRTGKVREKAEAPVKRPFETTLKN